MAVADTNDQLILKCAKDDKGHAVWIKRHDDSYRKGVLDCLGYAQHLIRSGEIDRKMCFLSIGNTKKHKQCKVYNSSLSGLQSVVKTEDIVVKARTRRYLNGDRFKGSKCTSDCSGHKAGYNWAQSENVTEISECQSQSPSFNKGCAIYVSEY